jgi:hypothetical protein
MLQQMLHLQLLQQRQLKLGRHAFRRDREPDIQRDPLDRSFILV